MFGTCFGVNKDKSVYLDSLHDIFLKDLAKWEDNMKFQLA